MPTKTASMVISAWRSGNSCKVNNTRTDGSVVYLYDKEIIRRVCNKVFIRTAGYPTKTTKDRLNCLDKVHVHTSRGIVYLNGIVWDNHEEWTRLG